jgi:uncharacterized membrane protein
MTLYCVCLFCGVMLLIFLVLSVVLCLFVLWSRVAHLFSALCCIVFVALWSPIAHLFDEQHDSTKKQTQYNREY